MAYQSVGSEPMSGDHDNWRRLERSRQSLLYRSAQQNQLMEESPEGALLPQGEAEESHPSLYSQQGIQNKPELEDSGARDKDVTTGAFLLLWWKELAAIVTSVAFLAAVFGVLLSIHDTKLENWSMPFDMQPTTLIALLTTLSRVFLLAVVAEAISQLKWVYFEKRPHKLEDIETFDSASRSAFGAAMFLGKIRWRAVAASLGAVITILVLAMVSHLEILACRLRRKLVCLVVRNQYLNFNANGSFIRSPLPSSLCHSTAKRPLTMMRIR